MQRGFTGISKEMALKLGALTGGGALLSAAGYAAFSGSGAATVAEERVAVSRMASQAQTRVQRITGTAPARSIETGGTSLTGTPGGGLADGASGGGATMIQSAGGSFALSPPDPAAATRVQSFDCAGSVSISRMLVCTHWEFATIDYNLQISYRSVLENAGDTAALRKSQREWLAALDKLGNNPGAVFAHYETRLRDLSSAAVAKR